jgi:predicted ATPase/class 3 adenylate cyclase
VTFLFTDIEGSTPLWEQEPANMRPALARHHAILNAAAAQNGGVVFKVIGDAFQIAFAQAGQAARAALDAQRGLAREAWPTARPLRVRMGLHAGPAEVLAAADGSADYAVSHTLNRAARVAAAGHGGQVLLSQAAVELAREDLPPGAALRDLGEHRLKGLLRAEHLYALTAPGLPADFPPLRTEDPPRHNLVRPLTRLVGRADSLRAAAAAVRANPLTTFTGPGGVGKTRLALALAEELLPEYKDGAWFADLAGLTDPQSVVPVLAGLLGVGEEPGKPRLETLCSYLRARQVLLVLDNCEHLLDACAETARALLEAAPRLRILATSREALGLPGEQLFAVQPLGAPPARGHAAQQASAVPLEDYPAVQLFVERAQAAAPGFVLDGATRGPVARICQGLDGLPLALELAAARAGGMDVGEIAARLEHALRLGPGARRGAPERQRTLAAAVDWSFRLLTEPERVLLRRLSVFREGCTPAAATAVCAGPDLPGTDALAGADIGDLLARLVERSMAAALRAGGQTRYRLLEVIRQFAAAQLDACGESGAVRARHCAYFAGLAEQAEAGLRSGARLEWNLRLVDETANLRAALGWALDEGQAPGLGLRIASALALRFWWPRLQMIEGRRWLEKALAAAARLPEPPYRQLAWGKACLAWLENGATAENEARVAEGLELCARAGPPAALEQAVLLGLAGSIRGRQRGDPAGGARLLEQAVGLLQQIGPQTRWYQAFGMMELSFVYQLTGDLPAVQACQAESVRLYRETGDIWATGEYLGSGAQALHNGDYDLARGLFARQLELYQAAGEIGLVNHCRRMLAQTAQAQGQPAEAVEHLREALRIAVDSGLRGMITEDLAAYARALASWPGPGQTARLRLAAQAYAAAEVLVRSGAALYAFNPAPEQDGPEPLRERLGTAEFDAAWQAGAQTPPEAFLEMDVTGQ